MKLQFLKLQPAKALPFFGQEISAGFPSPADGYLEDTLNLNELLVSHPAATFFVRVQGESMVRANIHSGDVLIVDRAQEPKHRSIVIAVLNGEFTVKRLIKKGKQLLLAPENPNFPLIEIKEDLDFQIWGVVTYVIHKAS